MSTDIAESLPKRKFAPTVVDKKDAPAPKGGGNLQRKAVVKEHQKKVQKKEFVKRYMTFVIVQEEKI